MHGKALDLLKQYVRSKPSSVCHPNPSIRLSESEPDMKDRLMPSITYLQRLGPEHLNLIFEHSRWIFEQDVDIAFDVSHRFACPRFIH